MFFVVSEENVNYEVLLGMPFFNYTKMTFTHVPDQTTKASFKFGGARLVAKVGLSKELGRATPLPSNYPGN